MEGTEMGWLVGAAVGGSIAGAVVRSPELLAVEGGGKYGSAVAAVGVVTGIVQ